MAGRDEDVAVAAEAVEIEPAVGGADPFHAAAAEAFFPAAFRSDLLDVLEELLHGRAIAVEPALDERERALVPERRADRKAGERARRAVPVALGAHAALADGSRPYPPLARGVGVRSEHVYFGGSEPPVSEGCIADQAREAAADDRALFGLTHAAFSRPRTPSSSASARNSACDQRSGRAGGPHRSTHSARFRGCSKCVLELLGELPVAAARRGGDPVQLGARLLQSPHLRIVPAEERGEDDPEPAAIELVTRVPMDAAADHELGLDCANRGLHQRIIERQQPERCGNRDQAGVEPAFPEPGDEPPLHDAVAAHRRADRLRGLRGPVLLDETRGQPAVERSERRDMHPAPLLPPVEAGHLPAVGGISKRRPRGRKPRRGVHAVPPYVAAERPDPSAVAVELGRRPLAGHLSPVDREAPVENLARRHALGPRLDHTRAPGEKRLRARTLADPAHRVGDEGAVSQPGVPVRSGKRGGEIRARVGLVLPDDGDTPGGEPAEAHFTEPASSPWTK